MNNRLTLSVAVITLNEEENLARCLESVRDLASEIVIIDSGSTDGTGEVAARYGARFEVQPWLGYVGQKNTAVQRCTQPWVLCLDADEAVSPELASAVRNVLTGKEVREAGFFMNRLNFYCGEWIRHAWYPEWRLRLARRELAQWVGGDVHERLEAKGITGRVTGVLRHYPFDSFMDHYQKALQYARLSADASAREGRSCPWHRVLFSPWFAFLKVLILKSGWRDGWRGWAIAGARWIEVFAKYSFLIERQKGISGTNKHDEEELKKPRV